MECISTYTHNGPKTFGTGANSLCVSEFVESTLGTHAYYPSACPQNVRHTKPPLRRVIYDAKRDSSCIPQSHSVPCVAEGGVTRLCADPSRLDVACLDSTMYYRMICICCFNDRIAPFCEKGASQRAWLASSIFVILPSTQCCLSLYFLRVQCLQSCGKSFNPIALVTSGPSLK